VPECIILLSGQVCAGKTTLARLLAARFGAIHVKTSECIRVHRPTVARERRAMQHAGEQLDRATGGAWVIDALRTHLGSDGEHDSGAIVVLDSVRIAGQIEAIRRGYGNRVLHLHLDAPVPTLAARYKRRPPSEIKELKNYRLVLENATERGVKKLARIADVVVSTDRCTEEDVLLRAASHAALFGKNFDRVVDVIVGGQYGSEGKGQVAAYLAPEYDLIVRVGGPNAGHTVWQHPAPYTFHHLPSGSNANARAELALGAGAVINVRTLLKEIADCQIEKDRLAIDPQAMIVTDADIAAEKRFRDTMGSTAQGVGLATARRILERDKKRAKCTIAENAKELVPFVRPVTEILDRHYRKGSAVMLEGTQGTGLSLYHGRYPYVTSRDTTVAGCLADAGISPSRVRKVVMVCRTYPIRVQSPQRATSGPMSREINWREVSRRSGVSVSELRRSEVTSTTKRKRRVSEFDWALLRRSASLNAPTDIALTFVDYLDIHNRKASRVEQLTRDSLQFIEEVQRVATAPVSLMSVRFHSRGIIDRRRW
jgi:adenylosuccinate synthase